MSENPAPEAPKRREFLCTDCDWIGSPEHEPDECPNCGSVNLEVLELE